MKVFAGVSCVILVSIKREGLEVNLNLPHLALLEYIRTLAQTEQQIEIYLPILLKQIAEANILTGRRSGYKCELIVLHDSQAVR